MTAVQCAHFRREKISQLPSLTYLLRHLNPP